MSGMYLLCEHFVIKNRDEKVEVALDDKPSQFTAVILFIGGVRRDAKVEAVPDINNKRSLNSLFIGGNQTCNLGRLQEFWRCEGHYAARCDYGGMALLVHLVPDQSDGFGFADAFDEIGKRRGKKEEGA
ncbi:hypothetical protein C8R45DRAFT_947875 [Mycena sanguinolenta]|nr:hypothetical protein C8R45DRAFT_947875 [Mycena sanguinolenta]